MTPRKIFARLAVAVALAGSFQAHAQISFSVNIGPPPLPVYEQPAVPGDGYIWTPGYWSWDNDAQAYYWVPGAWVLAPFVGGLWTPGYWFYSNNSYRWRQGYWSQQVGYYGGINYGYGYFGRGYDGGRWSNGAFNYNRLVNRVNPGIVRHVYDARVTHAIQPGGASFNGGRGGVNARPTGAERQTRDQRRAGPTAVQVQHERAAQSQPREHAAGAPPAIQQAPQRPTGQAVDHGTPPAIQGDRRGLIRNQPPPGALQNTPAQLQGQSAAQGQVQQPVRREPTPRASLRDVQPHPAEAARHRREEAPRQPRPEPRAEIRAEPRPAAPPPARMQAPAELAHPQGPAQAQQGGPRQEAPRQHEGRRGPEGREEHRP